MVLIKMRHNQSIQFRDPPFLQKGKDLLPLSTLSGVDQDSSFLRQEKEGIRLAERKQVQAKPCPLRRCSPMENRQKQQKAPKKHQRSGKKTFPVHDRYERSTGTGVSIVSARCSGFSSRNRAMRRDLAK